ncbi:MAG: MFS transporter [Lentisphaerota bacterium]
MTPNTKDNTEHNCCTNEHGEYEMHHSEKIPTKVKIAYSMGDFGANFFFQSVSIYLMYYFTDVFMITASAAGFIFLVSKIWDAVYDPVIGYLADHTNTRWGQKRPYLLFGAIPLGITLFLLYAAPQIDSYSMRVVYATFTFIAVCTLYATVNVPYSAMTANLTLDFHERGSLTGFRMMGAILGTLIVATMTKPLVSLFSSEVTGFRSMGMIYGAAIAIFTLITFFCVKERVRTHAENSHGSLKDIFKIIKSNPPLIFLFFGIFFHYAAQFVFLACVAYFFKYCIKAEGFIPVAFFCLYVPAAIMLPILVQVSKRWGKKVMFNGGMGIFAIGVLLLFFVNSYNVFLLVVIYAIIGLGFSAIYQGPWSTIPDTVEYSEWKTGMRREGIIYGIFFFGMKLSAGVSAFAVGYILNFGGYVPEIQQTETSLFTIRFLTTLLPILCYIIGAIFIWIYPITQKTHGQMVSEILNRSRIRQSK